MSGITHCKIHGRQSIYQICEHLHHEINAGVYTEKNYISLADIHVCESCQNIPAVRNLLKISVDNALKLPEKEILAIEAQLDKIAKQIPLKMICVKCYQSFVQAKKPMD